MCFPDQPSEFGRLVDGTVIAGHDAVPRIRAGRGKTGRAAAASPNRRQFCTMTAARIQWRHGLFSPGIRRGPEAARRPADFLYPCPQSAFENPSPVLVRLRHPEATNGLSLEVKFDQNRRLVSDDPPVVPRLDSDDRWSHELRGAAVCILNVDLAPGQEPDVRMHTEIRADDCFHVSGPAKSGRVDHTLNATGAGSHNIDLDAADFAAFPAP